MATTQTLKTGTRIEAKGTPMIGGFQLVPPEGATICRWKKRNGDIPNHLTPASPTNGGWHVVKFDADGATLLMHESGFRIIDNRA